MSNDMRQYTLRIHGKLLDKLEYIAEAYGRTKSKQLTQMIRKSISAYENKFGTITQELIEEMRDKKFFKP